MCATFMFNCVEKHCVLIECAAYIKCLCVRTDGALYALCPFGARLTCGSEVDVLERICATVVLLCTHC